jgi:hypothetical protein
MQTKLEWLIQLHQQCRGNIALVDVALQTLRLILKESIQFCLDMNHAKHQHEQPQQQQQQASVTIVDVDHQSGSMNILWNQLFSGSPFAAKLIAFNPDQSNLMNAYKRFQLSRHAFGSNTRYCAIAGSAFPLHYIDSAALATTKSPLHQFFQSSSVDIIFCGANLTWYHQLLNPRQSTELNQHQQQHRCHELIDMDKSTSSSKHHPKNFANQEWQTDGKDATISTRTSSGGERATATVATTSETGVDPYHETWQQTLHVWSNWLRRDHSGRLIYLLPVDGKSCTTRTCAPQNRLSKEEIVLSKTIEENEKAKDRDGDVNMAIKDGSKQPKANHDMSSSSSPLPPIQSELSISNFKIACQVAGLKLVRQLNLGEQARAFMETSQVTYCASSNDETRLHLDLQQTLDRIMYFEWSRR